MLMGGVEWSLRRMGTPIAERGLEFQAEDEREKNKRK
jgi:hypothetical protein